MPDDAPLLRDFVLFLRPACALCGQEITSRQSWHGSSNGYYHWRCEVRARGGRELPRVEVLPRRAVKRRHGT